MGAVTMGLVSGGMAAMSALGSGLAQSQQQRAQAQQAKAQAAQTRNQAKLAAQQGRVEAETIARQKSKLTREFNQLQGRNRVALGAGNVDMTSGSAMNVSLGNISNYANDIAENSYSRMLKEHETAQNVRTMNWQADNYDRQASYLQRSADNLGPTLLTAGLSGLASGLTTYVGAGGKFGFGESGAKTLWDDTTTAGVLKMRHPSGKWTSVPIK